MKALLLATLLLSLAAVGCAKDPDRDFGTSSIGDYITVPRVAPGAGPSALSDLRGTVRKPDDDDGCVWQAFLSNRNKARAVRATVTKSTRGGAPERYGVTVPAGGSVSLGCAHPFGGGPDTRFAVTDAAYAD